MKPTLSIIIASTRPGRVGPSVARWFHTAAEAHGGFATTLIDLAEVGLPFMDEPHHPRLKRYEKEHTRAWSRTVAAADAFVFVTPEYNHGPAPTLLNALDLVFGEWAYKPAAFVSYGGISGGIRAVQALKPVLVALKVMPIPEGVVVPMVAQQLDDKGVFAPNETQAGAVKQTLDELLRWTGALKPLRAG